MYLYFKIQRGVVCKNMYITANLCFNKKKKTIEDSLQDFSCWFSPSSLLILMPPFDPLLCWVGMACRMLWRWQNGNSQLSHKRQSSSHCAVSRMNALQKPDAILWGQWCSAMVITMWCWTWVSNSQHHTVSHVSEPPWMPILQLWSWVQMTAPWQHFDGNLIESHEPNPSS